MSEKTTGTFSNFAGVNKSQPLISEANFQLLKEAQQRLSQTTGFSPQVSKLINALITPERIDEVEQQFKTQFEAI